MISPAPQTSLSSNPPVRLEPARSSVPLVTVAICTRNRVRLLEAAVESVLRQMTEDTELLIVDNASTDTTGEVGARWAADAAGVVFCREGNVGLSAARNTALVRARGEFVLFLDDDAVAEPDWLAAYRRFLSAPPSARLAAVGGGVVPEYESSPPAWHNPRTRKLDLGDVARRVSARGGPWGCNIAYRREAALQAGRFDCELGRKGKFLGLHEEADLNRRLETAGGQIWWLPGARIRHFVPAERLTLRWQLHESFCGGRSTARMRLRAIPQWRHRVCWALGRLAAGPLQNTLILGMALGAACVGRQRVAVETLTRAFRTAGFSWQLLLELVRAERTPRLRRGLPPASSAQGQAGLGRGSSGETSEGSPA
jgi:GT2 family glycosyltransferase